MRLQTQLKKCQKNLTSTEKKEKQVRHKLRGTRSASSKLKQKLQGNSEIAKKVIPLWRHLLMVTMDTTKGP